MNWPSRVVTLAICLLWPVCTFGEPVEKALDFDKTGSSYWHLTETASATAIVNTAVVTIDALGIEVAGRCFKILYPAEIKANQIDVHRSGNASTSCKETPTPAEKEFDRGIVAARTVTHTGSELRFLSATGSLIAVLYRFQPRGLEFRHWRISAYSDGKKLVATERDPNFYYHSEAHRGPEQPFITFSAGGIEGSPGCGGLVGSYNLKGSQIDISAGALLAGKCLDHTFEDGEVVTKALSGHRTIEPADGGFVLRDKNGTTQIILSP